MLFDVFAENTNVMQPRPIVVTEAYPGEIHPRGVEPIKFMSGFSPHPERSLAELEDCPFQPEYFQEDRASASYGVPYDDALGDDAYAPYGDAHADADADDDASAA